MNVTVVQSLKEPGRPGLYPDISEREMYAIGKMTATWALLESLLIKMTLDLARYSGHRLPPDFVKNNTLARTVKELTSLMKRIKESERLKRSLGTILQRTNTLKTQRHALTHGVFSWDTNKPGFIRVESPKKQKRHEFDTRTIDKIAQKIAELNFEIMYPSGIDEFYKEKIKAGCGISRLYAILMSGEESDDPTVQIIRDKMKVAKGGE
jgi:hypothetical protein